MKPYAEKFYKSKQWKECRDAFFFYMHGICERCGDSGEIVHHRTYITPENINDSMITLNWENLELLCKDCHNKEHGNKVMDEELMFTADGDIIHKPPCF